MADFCTLIIRIPSHKPIVDEAISSEHWVSSDPRRLISHCEFDRINYKTVLVTSHWRQVTAV